MNIIEANERLINRRYIEALIGQKDMQEEETMKATKTSYALIGSQFDLKNMLLVNQMLVEFDSALERITDSIHTFWSNLASGRNIKTIFNQGI